MISGFVAMAVQVRLSKDVIVTKVEGKEAPYSEVKIGVENSQSLPDSTDKNFVAIVKEAIEKHPEQGVSFNETTGVLTYTPLPASTAEKKTSLQDPVEPAESKKKKESTK